MDKKLGDVLTIKELSAYLKIPKSTLYKLVREGKVPCQKIGHHWCFQKEAIDTGWKRCTAIRQIGRTADLDTPKVRPKDEGQGRPE